jgi:hypothetical protein
MNISASITRENAAKQPTAYFSLIFSKSSILTEAFSAWPNSGRFMETEGSLPCSEQPVIGLYSKWLDNSSNPLTQLILEWLSHDYLEICATD